MTGTGGTNSSGTIQTCTGQVAEAAPYYAVNNGNLELGGFAADAQGISFIAIGDVVQLRSPADVTMYPSMIQSGTSTGSVSTIYSPSQGGIFSALSMDSGSVYFTASSSALIPGSRGIFSVPRSGGQPTALYSGEVDSGPVTDGTNFYFLGTTASGNNAVLQIQKTGGSATTVADRGTASLSSIAMSGTDLYWLEQVGSQSTADFAIQKLSLGSGAPTSFATIPLALAPNFILAVGGKVVFATIPNISTIDLYTVAEGQSPVRVATGAGAPLVASPDGTIFYGSGQGLLRASIAFDHPTVVPNTQSKSITGVAIGPTDVWFADHRCIYKTAL